MAGVGDVARGAATIVEPVKQSEGTHGVWPRKAGQSNYNMKKLLILWSNMILNFSFLPFRPASIVGIVLKVIIKIFRKKNTKSQFEIKEMTNG